jgi:hypothetical protein
LLHAPSPEERAAVSTGEKAVSRQHGAHRSQKVVGKIRFQNVTVALNSFQGGFQLRKAVFGKNQNPAVHARLAHHVCGVDATGSRHRGIEDHQIGLGFLGLHNGIEAIGSLSTNLDVWLASKQSFQALPGDLVIIRNKHALSRSVGRREMSGFLRQ